MTPCEDDKPKVAEISPFQAGSDYLLSVIPKQGKTLLWFSLSVLKRFLLFPYTIYLQSLLLYKKFSENKTHCLIIAVSAVISSSLPQENMQRASSSRGLGDLFYLT